MHESTRKRDKLKLYFSQSAGRRKKNVGPGESWSQRMAVYIMRMIRTDDAGKALKAACTKGIRRRPSKGRRRSKSARRQQKKNCNKKDSLRRHAGCLSRAREMSECSRDRQEGGGQVRAFFFFSGARGHSREQLPCSFAS